MAGFSKTCLECGAEEAVSIIPMIPQCIVCGTTWTSWAAYHNQARQVVGPTYITDGNLHDDMSELVLAVEKKTENELLELLIHLMLSQRGNGDGTIDITDVARILTKVKDGHRSRVGLD